MVEEQAVYYCVLHGDGQDMVLASDRLKQEIVNVLAESRGLFDCRVYAFVLMESQIHLVLRTDRTRCDKLASLLLNCQTVSRGRRLSHRSEFVAPQYERSACYFDRRLLALISHIHQLPVRFGQSQHPNLARWSSQTAYLGGGNYPFVDSASVLALLSPDLREALRIYLLQLKKVVLQTELEHVFYREASIPQPFTSRSLPALLDDIAIHVREVTGVTLDVMRGKGRAPKVVEARRRLIACAVLEHSVPVSEVAKYLFVHHSYVSRLTFSRELTVDSEQPIA